MTVSLERLDDLPDVLQNIPSLFLASILGRVYRLLHSQIIRARWDNIAINAFPSRIDSYKSQRFRAFRNDEMRNLDPEACTQLAEKILQSVVSNQKAESIRQDPGFEPLMELLASYPITMEVILHNLKYQTPNEILTDLQSVDSNFAPASEDQTESIIRYIEYFYRTLAPKRQEMLLFLAPFTSFIDHRFIDEYIAELQEREALQDFDLANFDTVLQEIIQSGLLSPLSEYDLENLYGDSLDTLTWSVLSPPEEIQNFLAIQPSFSYFLKAKLNAASAPIRSAIEQVFREYYRSLAEVYNEQLLQSQNTEQQQIGMTYCRLEYDNLYQALEQSLAKEEDFTIFFCLDKYLELKEATSTELKLAQYVWAELENYPDAAKKAFERKMIVVCDFLAAAFFAKELYPNAQQQYEIEKQLINTAISLDEQEKQQALLGIYFWLLGLAHKLQEWEQAQRYYQQAIDLFRERNNVPFQAFIHYLMGSMAEELQEWEQARHHYYQALDIYIQLNDSERVGIYSKLGRIAARLQEWEQAWLYFHQAHDSFNRLVDDVYFQ